MNFSAIYELRDRLEAAAIAGVNLVGEDFRLKRAVEQMKALSQASPVFAKICQMGCRLTQEHCQDRAGVLLDMLALVDAVLCTQGTFLMEGQWETARGPAYGECVCTNFPYSAMAPLLEAFQGTGSGRYGVIRDAHDRQPELFQDYRIKSLMVKALGDSYGELADMVAQWLKKEGPQIIPLLKQGFDPKGKRDMARRLQVIEAVAGEEENQFYLEVLKTAGKEVKEAAIHALRWHADNEQLLLDLVKSEKGKAKDEAYFSLTCMEGEGAAGYWKKQMDKNPGKWVLYLMNSPAIWASDLIADHVNKWLDTYEASGILWKDLKREDQLALRALWNGAEGKHSVKICGCYERVYQVIPKEAAARLENSLKWNMHPALCQVAEEMYLAHGDEFLASVFWADLLTKEPDQVFERFSGYVKPEGASGFIKHIGGKKPDPSGIFQILSHVKYKEETGNYVIYRMPGSDDSQTDMVAGVLKKGMDLRWYELLLNVKNTFPIQWKTAYYRYGGHSSQYDAMLEGLLRCDVQWIRDAYGKYFYWNAMHRGTEAADIRILKKCGWSDYKGLLAHAGKRDRTQLVYKVKQILEELPLGNEEMAEELKLLVEGIGKKAVNGAGVLERWVDELKSGTQAEELKQFYR